ncbi:glycoside hydrolase family 130 protein [uncultured Sphingomonas sp.]|uniref:glycoside hydrolase family 130 protein n=1 Tax=uncultured Sphingomonas sp. TaxID=158754 RepID=UPI0025FFFF7B|nr:glycoside hydrolase family 130 protein [uncultured Sphingomonas sp.]
MTGTDLMTHLRVILRPDPSRTVVRPFEPADLPQFANGTPRTQRIAERILALDEEELDAELARIKASFPHGDLRLKQFLLDRIDHVPGLSIDRDAISEKQALVIGGYFCEEYSFEAAALFNPTIVLADDQSGVAEGALRFILGLRGIGEGHMSSITFRTGTWTPGGALVVDDPRPMAVPPHVRTSDGDAVHQHVVMDCGGSHDLSETVLFPVTSAQSKGVEDLRLVRFHEEDGGTSYLGTYTAFSGAEARSELLRVGPDFKTFEMTPLKGALAPTKGMALFPRRIDGRYAMLTRQDNENVWLAFSDDVLTWETAEKVIPPRFSWEFVQMGNCGSPIEIEEGWLVITHGVGSVRNYCLGASLLDKDDPSKLLGRMRLPLVHPSPRERDGYVPNVVYSCGALVHDRTLLLPYGVADSFTTFATVNVDRVLEAMA